MAKKQLEKKAIELLTKSNEQLNKSIPLMEKQLKIAELKKQIQVLMNEPDMVELYQEIQKAQYAQLLKDIDDTIAKIKDNINVNKKQIEIQDDQIKNGVDAKGA